MMGGKVFLIAESADFGEAVEGYIGEIFPEWSYGDRFKKYLLPEDFSSRNVLQVYGSIADWLEAAVEPRGLRRSVGVMDVRLLDLTLWGVKPNPLSVSQQKKFPGVALASLLILAFPEINWMFPGGHHVTSPVDNRREFMDHSLDRTTLRKSLARKLDAVPLFDPTGLRDYIRACIRQSVETSEATEALPQRGGLCAAVDDEEAYAFLHGYLAYKLGYRCHLVMTEAAIIEVFKPPADAAQAPLIDMTFEDVFLNFSDRVADVPHLSDLADRATTYQSLNRINRRIFVTAGHKHIEWHQDNQTYINNLKAADPRKHVRVVYKPSGGTYDILERGALLKEYWARRARELRSAVPAATGAGQDGGGHSAPGRLLLIAERLISRAGEILQKHRTVQDCVHGATLALEAQELLGYRTPTTSLQAIALRHQLEVTAECLFYGVGYSKDVKNRLREIEGEVNAVAHWFHPSLRRVSALNAQMIIVTAIIRIFRDHGQFDEEQQCLKYLRKLYRRSSFWSRPWLGLVYPFRWYVETLVGSFPLFIMALLLWPVLFGLVGWYFEATFGNTGEIAAFTDHVEHSFITFFGLAPMMWPKGSTQPLAVLIILMGFIHLGIFISHLYTLLSRR
jgi:hypothetical protein